MNIYGFIMIAIPTAASPEYGVIKDAKVITFAQGDNEATAELNSRGFIMDQGWQVQSVEAKGLHTHHAASRLDTDMQALYREALETGSSGTFYGVPLNAQVGDASIIRPLKPTFIKTEQQ
jgi:hypothetical protein